MQVRTSYSPPQHGGLPHWLRRQNWPLIAGSLIVFLLFVVAIKGPDWAPQDPMQENYALAVRGQIVRPPYPALHIPGFPLGTDQFGRDLLSRLLWAVQPTMTVVGIVALVRLVLGILMGLVIGWSRGRWGRFLEGILSLGLSIPVLLVALMGITAVGIHTGLAAFIFGLSLTGWAETARLVSEQTRITKEQVYIEAARALGSSDARILFKHVLRQIMPMVWMLLAFEVSATLLVTAELGFLGYYIGGGVWIEISDFQAVNTTGLPELGQMLATSLETLVKPWVMIVVGSVIFLAILGLNLLGEGFRQQASRPVTGGLGTFFLRGSFGRWVESQVSPAISDFTEANALRIGLVALIILVGAGASFWLRRQPAQVDTQPGQVQIAVPGGHLWATERHDAQGSRWSPVSGPKKADILWTFLTPNGAAGGPVVRQDGTVIVSALNDHLIAISPDGVELWSVELPEMPVGTPALGSEGQVYVTGQSGGLTAVDPNGNITWYFDAPGEREATSGPIVASDGTIFYTRVDSVIAVTAQGEQKWASNRLREYYEIPPVLSAGESFIFLRNNALDASSGVPVVLEGLPATELEFTLPTFFIGGDGKSYFRTGHEVYAWRSTQEGVELDSPVSWALDGSVLVPPYDQGATPSGLIWFFYGGDFFDTRLVWMDKDSRLLASPRLADRQSKLVAVDRDSVAYYCSSNFGANVNCSAIDLGANQPKWQASLFDAGAGYVGGAVVEGRIYVSTQGGTFYAIGESSP